MEKVPGLFSLADEYPPPSPSYVAASTLWIREKKKKKKKKKKTSLKLFNKVYHYRNRVYLVQKIFSLQQNSYRFED